MDHADRILTFALGFALVVIGLLVALLFVDATAVAKKRTPSGKVPKGMSSIANSWAAR